MKHIVPALDLSVLRYADPAQRLTTVGEELLDDLDHDLSDIRGEELDALDHDLSHVRGEN